MHANGRPSFQLHFDSFGRLVLTDTDNKQHVGAEPVRLFPISDPQHKISLCDADGNEIIYIEDLNQIPIETRIVLEAELNRRHFLPVIQRIIQIDGVNEPTRWQVETDRGDTTFSLKSEEDIRRVSGARVLIHDSHSIRYLIPDLNTLDSGSRRRLERYI